MINTNKIRIGSIFLNENNHDCIVVNMMKFPPDIDFEHFFYVCIEEENKTLSYLNEMHLFLYDISAEDLLKLKIMRY